MATATKDKPDAAVYDGSTPLGNARHETFANQYVIDSNAKQAYIRTGYEPKSAEYNASRLISNDKVWARVAYLRDEILSRARRSASEVIKEVEKIAFSDITNTVTWSPDTGMTYVKGSDEMDSEHSAAIESIQVEEKAIGKEGDGGMILKTKVKHHNKLKALELLGKEHGLFKDKVEVSGNVAHTIEVVNYGDDKGDK